MREGMGGGRPERTISRLQRLEGGMEGGMEGGVEGGVEGEHWQVME